MRFAFAVICLILPLVASAQNHITIRGRVIDSVGGGIRGATVIIQTNSDSAAVVSDESGTFSVSNLPRTVFSVTVSSIGFASFHSTFRPTGRDSVVDLHSITLRERKTALREVLIRGKIAPITLKKDTVEYDLGAFQPRKNDMLQDVIRRLPGLSVDRDGNVQFQGENVSRLKVNGRDFFSGNVNELVSQLPADIAAKIQIITDYGAEANFSGIKNGATGKTMNVVFQPDIQKGKFGQVAASGTTIGKYEFAGNVNYWLGARQISANLGLTTANNLVGIANTNRFGGVYRDDLGKKLNVYFDYESNVTNLASSTTSFSQEDSPLGTIFADTATNAKNKSIGKKFQTSLNYSIDTNSMLSLSSSANFLTNTNYNGLQTSQTGVRNQNSSSIFDGGQHSPTINSMMFFAHKFKKKGRTLSANVVSNYVENNNAQQIANRITYSAGTGRKDSVINRLLSQGHIYNSTAFRLSYSEPITPNMHVDVEYGDEFIRDKTTLVSSAKEPNGSIRTIDSLTDVSRFKSDQQEVNVNYHYAIRGANIAAGVTAKETSFLEESEKISAETAPTKTFSLSPNIKMDYSISPTSTLNFEYSESTVTPTPSQLNPLANVIDLQNIVIGNPLLKSAFTHYFNWNFRHISYPGYSLMILGSFNFTRNQIVINNRLIADTLNSLKQETLFLNANGNYQLSAGYNFSIPLLIPGGLKGNLNLIGNAAINHNIAFSNDVENINKSTRINQSAGVQVNSDKLRVEVSGSYIFSSNLFTITDLRPHNQIIWQLGLLENWTPWDATGINVNANYSVNNGYQDTPIEKSFIVDCSVSYGLLKKNALNITAGINDIFNQGNRFSRIIRGNTITDSVNKNVTRYFTLGIQSRFNKFGGNKRTND